MCVYVCMYICARACIYVCARARARVYIRVCVCVYACDKTTVAVTCDCLNVTVLSHIMDHHKIILWKERA